MTDVLDYAHFFRYNLFLLGIETLQPDHLHCESIIASLFFGFKYFRGGAFSDPPNESVLPHAFELLCHLVG